VVWVLILLNKNERNSGVLPQVSAGIQLWGTRGNNLYFKFKIIWFFFKTKTRPQYRVSSIANVHQLVFSTSALSYRVALILFRVIIKSNSIETVGFI